MWRCDCGLNNTAQERECSDCGMPQLLTNPREFRINSYGSKWRCGCGCVNSKRECAVCGMPKLLSTGSTK